jgi:hypothetical protein
MNNLRNAYESQTLFKQVLPVRVWEEKLAADHPNILSVIHDLGFVYNSQVKPNPFPSNC